ncbi:hypothetical protein [Streptomyces sp. NPDC059008]|uniref:hypothetical protein n=1 Tax=Streptomyces sp. NPDC059008 TaxID=3346693 RepID=UPI003682481D
MTPFLEWTGYVSAAVSAVNALGTLVRLRRKRSPDDGGTPRSGTAGRPRAVEGCCRCAARLPVAEACARVEAYALVDHRMTVRITLCADPAGGSTAGGGPGPW